MDVHFSDRYVASSCGLDTLQKAGLVADALRTRPLPGVTLVEPRPAAREELVGIHDASYVDAVLNGHPRVLAASAGLGWDEGLAVAVAASAGGCRDAAIAAWRDGVAGTLSSGLHHAGRSSGDGYCTFNGIALAARTFLDLGARAVLVLDLDAHCGGGTVDILGADPRVRQLDIATTTFDRYTPSRGSTLDIVDDAEVYLPTLVGRLDGVDTSGVDAVVCNAGVGSHEDCATGGLRGVTAALLRERDRAVFGWAVASDLPVAFALAGGTSAGRLGSDHLVRLHLATIEVAADASAQVARHRRTAAWAHRPSGAA